MNNILPENNELNLQSVSDTTRHMELHLFRKELTNSAKQRILEKKIADEKKINIENGHHNILSLLSHNILIEILPTIFKFLPLRKIIEIQTVCRRFYLSVQEMTKDDQKYIHINDRIIKYLFTSEIQNKNGLIKSFWSNLYQYVMR